MGALAISDLRMLDGEPRMKDLRLGEVLGFTKPVNVRKIVRRNAPELARHGMIFSATEKFAGQRTSPAAESYQLNEAQAVLVCMFSRTNAAAEVRRQIIQVFLAWRHGELTRSTPQPAQRALPDPWEQMANRHKLLAQAVMFDGMRREVAFSEALTILPPSWRGQRRRNVKPKWWSDIAVRQAMIGLYRQMTIEQARLHLSHSFVPERTPSRSAIGRFWCWLDRVQEAA